MHFRGKKGGGWVGGWVGSKAVLRIAYNNQKSYLKRKLSNPIPRIQSKFAYKALARFTIKFVFSVFLFCANLSSIVSANQKILRVQYKILASHHYNHFESFFQNVGTPAVCILSVFVFNHIFPHMLSNVLVLQTNQSCQLFNDWMVSLCLVCLIQPILTSS